MKSFTLKCTLCGNPTSTHIASSGHKYCTPCACKRFGSTNAHIMLSLELLQIIRGAISVPPRLSGWTAMGLYDKYIYSGILQRNDIADVVFRRTFHIDDVSTTLLWTDVQTQVAMSELLEKILVRMYEGTRIPRFDSQDFMFEL